MIKAGRASSRNVAHQHISVPYGDKTISFCTELQQAGSCNLHWKGKQKTQEYLSSQGFLASVLRDLVMITTGIITVLEASSTLLGCFSVTRTRPLQGDVC